MTMGTFASLTVVATGHASLDDPADTARRVFDALNSALSAYLPDSDIARLNRAGTNTVTLGPAARAVIEVCREYHALSHGAFDPTVMPLVRLWGFSGAPAPRNLPTPDAIADARARTGLAHLEVIGTDARFDRDGMSIDLGGIAKGYAVDRVYEELLRAAAPPPILINLGGNIRCHGARGKRHAWRIGVRNPFDHEAIVGVLELPDGMATATSGNYERFVTIDGKRYSHIIDPTTGFPSTGMAGVTVLSVTATEADALSTSLFIAGPEAGARMLADRPRCGAIFIPDRQPIELWITPAFDRRFTPAPALASHLHPIR